jgi:predicted ATPase
MTCPSLVVLATSREPLGIGGEWVLRVQPLSVPASAELPDRERLLEYDGIRLFVELARAAEPSFRLTSVTASSVVEICRKLDGIPLALELAAMRVRGMGVAHLDARLDDRFRLLTGSGRAGEPRQRTLYATVDWSYGLLSDCERIVMCRLGVFTGDFSLKSAEAVCVEGETDAHGPSPITVAITAENMLDDLTRLVDKSPLHSIVVVSPCGDALLLSARSEAYGFLFVVLHMRSQAGWVAAYDEVVAGLTSGEDPLSCDAASLLLVEEGAPSSRRCAVTPARPRGAPC